MKPHSTRQQFLCREDYTAESSAARHLHVSNGDLNLHTRLDGDGGDLLDDVSRGVQVDQALVDPAW